MDRRRFLAEGIGAATLAALPADFLAQTGSPPRSEIWDAGRVRHLLPTASDTRILIKASLTQPVPASPILRIGGQSVPGQMNDTRGEFWQFYAEALQPGRPYMLSLSASNAALCEPWELSTLPDLNVRSSQCRVLFFTCAGGHDGFGFVPAATRNRLLRRALSYHPQAAVANGERPEPAWGWVRQRKLVISGDLHAVALGRMLRCGTLDLKSNPITTVLAGPLSTGADLWPSAFRGVGPTPPAHLDVREEIAPIEQHGFTLADFLPDRIVLRFFKWDIRTQPPEAIDNLEPFHTTELGGP